MLFNSVDFMCFLPVVLGIYFIIPKSWRHIWLLVTSYYFYMGWNPKYAVLIAFSTVITYCAGIGVAYTKEKKCPQWIVKGIVALGILINLVVLVYFKYFEFGVRTLEGILRLIGVEVGTHTFDIILPVGISFYTFQALSYVIDVYRGQAQMEKNILKYALFVSFFPQLVAGPIERSNNLLSQVKNVDKIALWNMNRVVSGAIYMVWGYFVKMVIADRAAILVDTVFDSYYMYGSTELIVAALLFAVQIYGDFMGYSMIAIGLAKVMGFTLMENFDAPYYAGSIKEFWHRWHISLSTWFRDYIYIPLGGNRKGTVRKYINLMITFLLSGLWHGASWNFVIWGGLHGLYQVVGEVTLPIKKKVQNVCKMKTDCMSHKLLKVVITVILVTIAWVFFRADSIEVALDYLQRMVTKINPWCLFDGTLYTLGLERGEMKILVLSLVLLAVVDGLKYFKKKSLDEFLLQQNLWFSWSCVVILIMSIVIYGVYGPTYDATQFIYFQF